MPVVVGVDSSTQSTKVEVRDLDSCELISTGRASHASTGITPVSESNPTEWICMNEVTEGLVHQADGIISLRGAADSHDTS